MASTAKRDHYNTQSLGPPLNRRVKEVRISRSLDFEHSFLSDGADMAARKKQLRLGTRPRASVAFIRPG